MPLAEMSPIRRTIIKLLRIIMIAVRKFSGDQCALRASALTFYSLLSVVPVVAMAFGIAKGFGFERVLQKQLMQAMAGQEEIASRIIEFAGALLDNTRGGVVAGIGIVVLIWSVMKVLGNIEHSFNYIWQVEKARSIGRKVADYLSIMLIAPVLVMLSSSVTVFITTQVNIITIKIALLGYFSPVIHFFLNLLPYGLIWIVFIFIYIIMPNTRVNFFYAALAGVIAGTTYNLAQWGYIAFQVGIVRNNAIYGSFAALPLFLAWVQISWFIVLFGAELAYAFQNVGRYEYNNRQRAISHHQHKLVALSICHSVVRRFQRHQSPATPDQLARALRMPGKLIEPVLENLVQSNILSRVNYNRNDTDNAPRYQPAFDINQLSIQMVLSALDRKGSEAFAAPATPTWEHLESSLTAFDRTIAKSPENKLLKDIVK